MGAPFLMIASGLFSAASSVMGGQSQAAAAQYQAQVAEQNRALAQQQAQMALAEGAREEHKFRSQQEQFQASQAAQLAASGAQVTGSPLQVMADTSAGIEEDVKQIRFNALKNMWGYEAQGAGYESQAIQSRAAAKGAETAGWMGAFGSLLGTGADVWSTTHSTAKPGGTISVNPSPWGIGTSQQFVPPDSQLGVQIPGQMFDPGYMWRPNR